MLNLEVRTQRDNIGPNGENNVSSNQASRNVMSSLSVGDLTPSRNANTELEKNSDTSRGSHVRPREEKVCERLRLLPQVGRAILSRNRRIISDIIGIEPNHPHEGILSPRNIYI